MGGRPIGSCGRRQSATWAPPVGVNFRLGRRRRTATDDGLRQRRQRRNKVAGKRLLGLRARRGAILYAP
jgi:hypothetical protein